MIGRDRRNEEALVFGGELDYSTILIWSVLLPDPALASVLASVCSVFFPLLVSCILLSDVV